MEKAEDTYYHEMPSSQKVRLIFLTGIQLRLFKEAMQTLERKLFLGALAETMIYLCPAIFQKEFFMAWSI